MIVDGSIVNADISNSADIAGSKLSLVSTSSTAGIIVKGDGSSDGYLQLNCSQNSHGIKLKSPPHSASQSYTLTFPSAIINGAFLKTDANGNLSFAAVNTDLVNDTSPQLGGDLDTNSHHILLDDDHNLKFGNDTDLEIFHQSSSDTNLINSHKLLKLMSNGNTELRTNNNDLMIKAQKQGAVELYHNNVKKAFTGSTGFNIDGNCDLVNDNNKLQLGNDGDLQLFHDGTNSFIVNQTGTFYIKSKSNQEGAKFIPDGAVELNHNGSKKFETTSTGVDISGNLDLSGYVENHFAPSADNTYDLGFSSYRWRNIYTNDLNLSNEGHGNDVDGTWGSYTIQEGADDLFLINKRNGKKYKFNLTEVN